ncbi:hypothetical protein AHAS_Ahas18G0177600 [Arachis hypogaea]
MMGNDPVNLMLALENMVAAMQATTETLGNQAGNRNGVNGDNKPMTVATFLKIHPPIFGGSTNPTEAVTLGFLPVKNFIKIVAL